MSKKVKNMAQLPAITMTEQPILLTVSMINRPGDKFSKYIFAENGLSNLVLVLVLILESKGP